MLLKEQGETGSTYLEFLKLKAGCAGKNKNPEEAERRNTEPRNRNMANTKNFTV